MTGRPHGPFRRALNAMEIGGRHFEPLPEGMAMKLHQRRISARKSLAQIDGKKWTTKRGERDGTPGVWIERVS